MTTQVNVKVFTGAEEAILHWSGKISGNLNVWKKAATYRLVIAILYKANKIRC